MPVRSPAASATDQCMAVLQQHPADDADEAHDGADREVDAAGDDHRHHADRHDADEGEVAGDVVEIRAADAKACGCRKHMTAMMTTSATVTQNAWLEINFSKSDCSRMPTMSSMATRPRMRRRGAGDPRWRSVRLHGWLP